MRLFFGIPIENSMQNVINKRIDALKGQYNGNYTLMSNMHITLTFIGEVEPKVSYMLSDIGDKAFCSFQYFVIKTADIDSFKDGKVNYLGIDNSEILTELHNRLNLLLDEAGIVYTSEDIYTPHITLRRGTRIPLHIDMDSMDIGVDRVCLFESKRVDGMLRYIPLKTWMAEER